MSAQKVYVTKRFTFEAAHFLPSYDGKCAQLHGHSYKLEVTLSAYKDFLKKKDALGGSKATDFMVLDFSEIKRIVNEEVVDLLDHSNLNATFSMPTAEVMCVYLYETIKMVLRKEEAVLESVRLWETEDSFAEYKGESE